MASNEIKAFTKGVHNQTNAEIIDKDAAQDSKNYITREGRVILAGGRQEIGTGGTVGKITGQHFGYTISGDRVHYRKAGTIIEYWDGSAWSATGITGLEENEDYSFANYASLAGNFTFINGKSAYYKLNNANPDSALSVYDSSKNFYGRIMIDRGRTLLWNRAEDKTGLYGSHIDPQNSDVYTTVTDEAVGSSGSTNYTGTLAFVAAKRNCFGVTFEATVAAGTETFIDNYDGTVTSNYGGTGTVNYITGVYDIDFSDTTTGAVTVDYQWEDSTVDGVCDFGYSATRLAGEGFQFPQDIGGDAILTVLIGEDNNYYSLKEQSAYVLSLDVDDTNATNEVYRTDIGIPHWKAAVSTSKGIMFMNTANQSEPVLTILQRNKFGTDIEPFPLVSHFDFSNYDYDDSFFSPYDRWILIACKSKTHSESADANDTILMVDQQAKIVDIIKYTSRWTTQNAGLLYTGDSITKTTYEILSGFDDLDDAIDNYWIGKKDNFTTNNLKKTRRLRIKGRIHPDQVVEVYSDYDASGFSLVGTILGSGSYVDTGAETSIGSSFIGDAQVGGDDLTSIYDYYIELKLKTPKFKARTLKFIATGIGYFDFDSTIDWDILRFEDRMPKNYRSKANVETDGTEGQENSLDGISPGDWNDGSDTWDG